MFRTPRRVLFQLALASVAALVMVVASPSAWAQHNRHNGWGGHHGGGHQHYNPPVQQRQHHGGGHHNHGINRGAAIGLGLLGMGVLGAIIESQQPPQFNCHWLNPDGSLGPMKHYGPCGPYD